MKKILLSIFCCLAFAGKSPVYWGVAATAPRLQLGNYSSLNYAIQAAGKDRRLVVLVDDTTAGLDPFGSNKEPQLLSLEVQQKNAASLSRQIQEIASHAEIVLASKYRQPVSFPELLKATKGVNVNSEKLSTALYPYSDSFLDLEVWQGLKLKEVMRVCGKDQISNATTSEQLGKNEGILVTLFIHPLLTDPWNGNKMGKGENNAVFLGDEKAIREYVNAVPDVDLPYIWNMLGDGQMPQSTKMAKKQLTEQLIKLPGA